MPRIARTITLLLHAEDGASMAEYALLIAAVALVGVVGARQLGAVWEYAKYFDWLVSIR